MKNQKPTALDSEPSEAQKIVVFEATPSQENVETTGNLTDWILRLLNEKIQGKIDWEHDRLILSGGNEQEQPLGQVQFLNKSPESFGETNKWKGKPQGSVSLFMKEKQNARQIQRQIIDYVSIPKQEAESTSKLEKTAEKKKIKGCTCKKSFCLKMYCECFRNGKECVDCECVGCKNTKNAHEDRSKAVKLAMQREPTAFNSSFKYKGCRCTRSQCVKGYCECFMEGHTCGKYCKCLSCKNRLSSKARRGSDTSTIPETI